MSAPSVPRWQRFPSGSLALTILLCAFTAIPPVRGNPSLERAFLATAGALLLWQLVLWIVSLKAQRVFAIEFVPPLESHYIQSTVQLSIYTYWGFYWPKVFEAAPLIFAQMVFFYALDALLSWSRGRKWRLGFGPVPIIFSTNFFLWFKDDWFIFQFAMIAACALGKEFIKWNRNGKRTHIFNPSAFGLSLVSIVLIATGSTNLTWGVEVATTLSFPPHIYLLIFALGLVVQYFFAVTLMTLSAVAVIVALDLAYFGSTGVYHFVDTNIPIAVFLGMHLLVTDPSTSPRTNLGRILFGGIYGAANFLLFGVLSKFGVPDFYDKLIPVPFLNLAVSVLDRVSSVGILARLDRIGAALGARKLNLVHMGCWIVLFAAMLTSGYVEAQHPGASLEFWQRAWKEGKPRAGANLLRMAQYQAANGSAAAHNVLGEIYLEGKIHGENRAAAAHHFARACKLGDPHGCANVARQFLFLREGATDEVVANALNRLEEECSRGGDGLGCFLVGYAYESGIGRRPDAVRALQLYEQGCRRGSAEACNELARFGRPRGADVRGASATESR